MLVREVKDTTLVDWEAVLEIWPKVSSMAQARFRDILLTSVFDITKNPQIFLFSELSLTLWLDDGLVATSAAILPLSLRLRFLSFSLNLVFSVVWVLAQFLTWLRFSEFIAQDLFYFCILLKTGMCLCLDSSKVSANFFLRSFNSFFLFNFIGLYFLILLALQWRTFRTLWNACVGAFLWKYSMAYQITMSFEKIIPSESFWNARFSLYTFQILDLGND